jgi:hypothetical protein
MTTRLEPDLIYHPREMGGLHPIGEEPPQDAEWTERLGPRSQEVLDEIRRLAETGQLQQYLPKSDALPVFALGFVGGAIGARLLKGATGLVVAGGVAYWAWQRLGK